MNKRVLSMLSAGVVAASTLLSSVPAFAAHTGSGYVLMNIPYSVFYGAQDSGATIDAVSTATSKINGAELAKGGYADADNNIKGVTVPVYVKDLSVLTGTEVDDDDRLEVSMNVHGTEYPETLVGKDVLIKSGDYAYYVLKDAPAVYADLTVNGNSYSISELKGGATTTTTVDATMADGEDAYHASYEIAGIEQESGTIYGAILSAKDGSHYALKHISGIWWNKEYGFAEESFSGIAGKELTSLTLYTDQGIKTIDFKNPLKVNAYLSATVYSEDPTAVSIEDVTADAQNVKVSVYVWGKGWDQDYYATDAAIVDGKVVLSDGKMLEEGKEYQVVVKSDNYATKTYTLTYPTARPAVPVTPGSNVTENKNSSRHNHTYEWTTTKAATATTDGVMKYRCTKCGTVEYEVPISAYYVFNKDTQQAIKNAAAGATVTVSTPIFISFHEMVKEALVERSDVTLVVDYKNAGSSYEMTIPAGSGATLESLFGQDRFAGFLYLGGAFATVAK